MLMLKDWSGIVGNCHLAWQETMEEVESANRQAIQSVRYDWPRQTRRSNGDVVDSPRDIVDTENLLNSQYIERIDSDTFVLGWGATYATDVHEGEGNKPARRWTREAIRGDESAPPQWQNSRAILNVPTTFADRFRAFQGLG